MAPFARGAVMIDLHPAGMTVKQWFMEIRKRKKFQGSVRQARERKAAERKNTAMAKPAFMQKAFGRIFRRAAK